MTRSITRRAALAGATAMALPLAVTLVPAPARAADKLRVGKAITSSFPFAGLELGKEQGIWAAEGLDVIMIEHRGVGMSRHDDSGADLAPAALTIEQVVDDVAAGIYAGAVLWLLIYFFKF